MSRSLDKKCPWVKPKIKCNGRETKRNLPKRAYLDGVLKEVVAE